MIDHALFDNIELPAVGLASSDGQPWTLVPGSDAYTLNVYQGHSLADAVRLDTIKYPEEGPVPANVTGLKVVLGVNQWGCYAAYSRPMARGAPAGDWQQHVGLSEENEDMNYEISEEELNAATFPKKPTRRAPSHDKHVVAATIQRFLGEAQAAAQQMVAIRTERESARRSGRKAPRNT